MLDQQLTGQRTGLRQPQAQTHKMQATVPSSSLSSRAARRFCARNAERLRSRVLNVPQRPVRGLAKCSAQAIVSNRARTSGPCCHVQLSSADNPCLGCLDRVRDAHLCVGRDVSWSHHILCTTPFHLPSSHEYTTQSFTHAYLCVMIKMPGAFHWLGVCMEPCTTAAACGVRVAFEGRTY